MKKIIKCCIASLILLVVLVSIYKYNLTDIKDQEITSDNGSYFEIEKIVAYSSANAKKNEENQRPDWEVSVYQFTDIAIYIKTIQSDNKQQSSINKIYVKDMKLNVQPKLGTATFYEKDLNDFGDIDLSAAQLNKLDDNSRIEFEVIENNEELQENKLQFKKDGSIPLIIGYFNEDVRKNYIINDTQMPLKYDASILKRVKVPINAIESSLNFTVEIVDDLGNNFKAKVEIELPITDELYEGSQIVILEKHQKFAKFV